MNQEIFGRMRSGVTIPILSPTNWGKSHGIRTGYIRSRSQTRYHCANSFLKLRRRNWGQFEMSLIKTAIGSVRMQLATWKRFNLVLCQEVWWQLWNIHVRDITKPKFKIQQRNNLNHSHAVRGTGRDRTSMCNQSAGDIEQWQQTESWVREPRTSTQSEGL